MEQFLAVDALAATLERPQTVGVGRGRGGDSFVLQVQSVSWFGSHLLQGRPQDGRDKDRRLRNAGTL